MKSYELTEHQRATITNGLRVAAAKFHQNAVDLRNMEFLGFEGLNISHRARLAAQFEAQYDESIQLAQQLDDSERIEVHP